MSLPQERCTAEQVFANALARLTNPASPRDWRRRRPSLGDAGFPTPQRRGTANPPPKHFVFKTCESRPTGGTRRLVPHLGSAVALGGASGARPWAVLRS